MPNSPILLRSGIPVNSLFSIHGQGENEVSSGFAAALAWSPKLLLSVLRDLGARGNLLANDISIHIQTARKAQGITDIEIKAPGAASIVIEAKLGSDLPSLGQLRKYDEILRRGREPFKRLVALTGADSRFISVPPEWRTLTTPVVLRSWRWARRQVQVARSEESSLKAKFVLGELLTLLEAFVGLETAYSNQVYVVSLGAGHPTGWQLSWIDIVEKHSRYFYSATKKNWPLPPNYLGFRYRGRLQSIHHVDIVEDVREHFPGASGGPSWGRHYLFSLGPPIRPPREMRPGPSVQRNTRVWCMLDTLLTSDTITEAVKTTRERKERAEQEQRAAA